MRFLSFVFALPVMLCVVQPVLAEKPPVSLARTAPWHVSYDVDSCHLLGQFGTGDDKISILFTSFMPGSFFKLSLFGKPFATDAATANIVLNFGDLSKPFNKEAMAGKAAEPDRLPALFLQTVRLDGWNGLWVPEVVPPTITPEMEASVKFITVKQRGRKTYRLETKSLGRQMEALRVCGHDLVKSWGFDPVVQANLSRPAELQDYKATLLSGADYPNKAKSSGHNGLVTFRLDIDEAGLVTGCRVLYRTNPDEFADLTCRLLQRRVKMLPALDAAGKPVRSFYIRSVNWRVAY